MTHKQQIAVVLAAYESELAKIATVADPSEIVQLLHHNQALRRAASPDLLQKLRPGTGSLFQALGEKGKLMLGGMKAKSEANRALGSMASRAMPGAAANIHEDSAALGQLGRVRQAENELHGPGLTGKKTPAPHQATMFSGGSPISATHGVAARNVAFGAGAGAAGILGAQHYWKKRQDSSGYPPSY